MFEAPAAKRVKRFELFSSEADIEANLLPDDVNQDENTLPDYGFDYEFVESNVVAPVEEARKEETFQFNLFRTATKTTSNVKNSEPESNATANTNPTQEAQEPQVALISIRSPTPEPSGATGPGGLNRPRPDSFYFTASAPSSALEKLHQEYSKSTISGEAILTGSRRPWPGTHLPWRIISFPTHLKQIVEDRTGTKDVGLSVQSQAPAVTTSDMIAARKARQRPRPSKKRRDLLKKKSVHRQALIDASKTKEEHEKEKRNKKNRERKLKRRAKERREKEEVKNSGVEAEEID